MNPTFTPTANYKTLKRLLPLCIFLSVSIWSTAQVANISFTLLHQPCNNDGILVAYDSGQVAPITFTWYLGGQQVVHVSNTNYDTLYNYSGVSASVNAIGTGSGTSNYGYFTGAPPFTFRDSTTVAICPALGTATAFVTGGTAPYTYQWTDTGNVVVSVTNPAHLAAGAYNLLITDAAGCTYGTYHGGSTFGSNYAVYIQGQSSILDSTRATVANCTNGTATVTSVTGGVAPYSYHWSNGANTMGITGLMAGYYNVIITDSIGCSTTAYVFVSQSVTIAPHATITNATCLQNDGSVIELPSGGTAPYTYVWSNGQHTQSATGLVAGYYYVTITDAHSCTGSGYATVTATTPVTVTYSATASLCTAATGTATLNITGGTAPYTTNWSTYPAQTSNTATGLAPGDYSFLVTDATGCIRTGTAHVPPVSLVTGYVLTVAAQCVQANGSATAIVLSGVAPYTYHWNNGATTSSISGLAAGWYTCTITDNMSCSAIKSKDVATSTPITLGLHSTDASCIFTADGNVAVTAVGGTTPYTYNWSNGQTSATASGLVPGRYYVYIVDAAGCVQNAWTDVSYNPSNNSCYCTLTGTVYNDLNGNCVVDSGDLGIQNIMVHCSGVGYAFTNSAGVYSIIAPTGNFTLSEDVEYYYPLASCQNNSIAVSVSAAQGCVLTNNFANVVNPIHDIRIVTSELNPPVVGYTYNQKVVVENNGTITEPGIQMGYKHDGQLTFTGVVPGIFTQLDPIGFPDWYSVDSAFPSLTPGSRQAFDIAYTVPANIPLGTNVLFNDTVAYAAPMANWLNDYTPWDNVISFQTTTVGSYDPNGKEVSPKGTTAAGYITTDDSVLNYTVHFQNTGSYPAQKVVVLDTLDANLNINTLRPGYSNYAYTATVSENGAVKFTFDNINLPTSTSEPIASIGILMYSIHLKPNLANGTIIKSPASIYFDFNAGVTTNTTLNTITGPTGVTGPGKPGVFDFTIFPNPANAAVTMIVNADEASGISNLKFYNVVGEMVQTQAVKPDKGTNRFTIDISALTPGIYFATIISGDKVRTEKLIVLK